MSSPPSQSWLSLHLVWYLVATWCALELQGVEATTRREKSQWPEKTRLSMNFRYGCYSLGAGCSSPPGGKNVSSIH